MNYDREFLTGTVGVLILSLLGEPARASAMPTPRALRGAA
jgi:hypothetical protein